MRNPVLKKLAIFIADSGLEPFPSIKSECEGIHLGLNSDRTKVFFISGEKKCEPTLSRISDKIRYTKLWPIQYSVDNLTLKLKSLREIKISESGNSLSVGGSKEGLRFLGRNFLAATQYAYSNKFDFMVKTTISSVFNPEKLWEFLDNHDWDYPLYAGRKIAPPDGRVRKNFTFVSGSCVLLNRESMRLVLENARYWDHGLLDDVALGRLLHKKVPITEFSSADLSSISGASTLPEKYFQSIVHFRCKSAQRPRNDSEIMKLVFNRFR